MKKMHLKKQKKYFKFLIFLFIIAISYLISLKLILNNELKEEKYINYISDVSFNNNTKYEFVIKESVKLLSKIDISKPETMLDSKFNLLVNSEINKKEEKKKTTNQKKVINTFEEKKDPVLYIYNTHQHEKYSENEKGVMDNSKLLKEKLEKYGIYSINEEASVVDFINTSGISYNKYYGTTRIFLNNAKENNPTLKFFIDLHRDGIKKEMSTININNKNYAKVLFVIASSNKNYEENEKEAKYISDKINEKYNGLSRGIFKRDDGNPTLYNQDISKYVFLIEIGGNENTYDEVENTIDAVSEILSSYIKENT